MTQSRRISAHSSHDSKLGRYMNPPSAFFKSLLGKLKEKKKS